MHVAIVCPGPSLLRTWRPIGRPRYDRIIAVNYAINYVDDIDWLVGCDLPLFCGCGATNAIRARLPRVGLVTASNVWEAITTGKGSEYWNDNQPWDGSAWARLQLVTWESLSLVNETAPCNYSVVAALGFALACPGVQVVDVYGADMVARPGVDGIPGGRSDERWAAERRDLRAVAARAPRVHVRRILPFPE